jgi:transcriptional regulator with XRE-family HTH domain
VINPNTLRHHRILAGLSQRGLAKTAGLGPLGIKRIEDGADAGRLPLAVALRIAEALNITLQELLDAPPAPATGPVPDPAPLDYNQAKLLRRLQRGEDITRHLTRADRELTIPFMLSAAMVCTTTGRVRYSKEVATSLRRHSGS